MTSWKGVFVGGDVIRGAASVVQATADLDGGIVTVDFDPKQIGRSALEEAIAEAQVNLSYTAIRAPQAGKIVDRLAEPGDIVSEGQLLARMDGREVRLKLAEIAAEMHRAGKQRDSHQARHQVPEAVMAELEIERLEASSKLLQLREDGLEVASPIAGVDTKC